MVLSVFVSKMNNINHLTNWNENRLINNRLPFRDNLIQDGDYSKHKIGFNSGNFTLS